MSDTIGNAREFIAENLAELADELTKFDSTGVVVGGKIEEVTNLLQTVAPAPENLGLAMALIATMCIEAVATNGKY